MKPPTSEQLPYAASRTVVVLEGINDVERRDGVIADLLRSYPTTHILLVTDTDTPAPSGFPGDDAGGVHVLHLPSGCEGATAWWRAVRWCAAHGFDVVVGMAGDGSHRPSDVELLLWQITGYDVVVGSRWVEGGRIVDISPVRRWWASSAAWLLRRGLGLDIRDAASGLIAVRAAALSTIEPTTSKGGWRVGQVDTIRHASGRGLTMFEMPVATIGLSRDSLGLLDMAALWRTKQSHTRDLLARPQRQRRWV